ncbi:MAG: tRNA lysidine(34) synthetase TilS [Candidatus Aminicenantes bacterium]|nr:tRNA lysidine(34) synthetase TilS [Candidatus Aminicenantes bacterium]
MRSKVIEAIKKYSLFHTGDSVVIACSGGSDSVSLVCVMRALRKQWDLKLIMAHYNHRLRSEAEKDHAFVQNLASRFSLPFESETGNVREYARKEKMNLEEAGRKLRYRFLKKTARKHGAAKIATGHTMTDQAETVLMRILRGTGSHGLGGIWPKTEDGVVRPLILVTRDEVLAYLEQNHIEYRIDESNFDTRFLRNKIRHRLIPYLKNNFDPEIVSHLSRLALITQEEDLFLDDISTKKSALAEVLVKGQRQLDLDFLKTLPLALQRRVVREYLWQLRGDLWDISYEDIHSVISLGRGKEFHLEQGLVLKNQQGRIGVKKNSPKTEFRYLWSAKRALNIENTGLIIQGRTGDRDEFSLNFYDRKRAFFDRAQLEFPLEVRSRQPGDRYRPLGSPGRQKLKELMRARRIPESDRDQCPVFLSGGEIIWVLGLPISEKHKVTDSTEKVLQIKIVT